MRTILYIIRKEFLQIFRNKSMLPIIFVLPIIQLLLLANAATFAIHNSKIEVVDYDHSQFSRHLISKFSASPFFNLAAEQPNARWAKDEILRGNTDIVMIIPADFEKNLRKENHAEVQFLVDAINGSAAGIINGYANSILFDFNKNIIAEAAAISASGQLKQIKSETSYWFNQNLDYHAFMVPGILVLLVTLIGMFLTAMNIVKEKEMGTIEQLNVTPIAKSQFIIGKLTPFWILGMLELSIGLIIAKYIFLVPFLGSLLVIYSFASIYLLVVLGIGLFVSTVTETQQQAIFVAWFFMLIFILLSGFFTPIESMPHWAQTITLFDPIRYFVEVMRMVLLKGSGFRDLHVHFAVISAYALVVNGLAVWNYKKRV